MSHRQSPLKRPTRMITIMAKTRQLSSLQRHVSKYTCFCHTTSVLNHSTFTSAISYPISKLEERLRNSDWHNLFRRYLYDQKYPHGSGSDVSIHACPEYEGKIKSKQSASITFFMPSDPTGISGRRKEQIRATPSFKGSPRYDTVLVRTGVQPGPHGLSVAGLLFLFSFSFEHKDRPTALVRWFTFDGESPDEDTGMWIVKPQYSPNGSASIGFISMERIVRACHLIPVYGTRKVPPRMDPHKSLASYKSYYLNKYIDHHAFEILS
jgi:hypothetical protein